MQAEKALRTMSVGTDPVTPELEATLLPEQTRLREEEKVKDESEL